MWQEEVASMQVCSVASDVVDVVSMTLNQVSGTDGFVLDSRLSHVSMN